jgi:hypothetical protein
MMANLFRFVSGNSMEHGIGGTGVHTTGSAVPSQEPAEKQAAKPGGPGKRNLPGVRSVSDAHRTTKTPLLRGPGRGTRGPVE